MKKECNCKYFVCEHLKSVWAQEKMNMNKLKRRLKLVNVCYDGLIEALIEDGIFIEGKHYHKGFVGDRSFKLNGEDYSYDNSIDSTAHYISSLIIIADLDSDYADIEMKLDEEIA